MVAGLIQPVVSSSSGTSPQNSAYLAGASRAEQQQLAVNLLSGGRKHRRKYYRGGAIQVPTVPVAYSDQNGSQGVQTQFANLAKTSTQGSANAVGDKYATMKGGGCGCGSGIVPVQKGGTCSACNLGLQFGGGCGCGAGPLFSGGGGGSNPDWSWGCVSGGRRRTRRGRRQSRRKSMRNRRRSRRGKHGK